MKKGYSHSDFRKIILSILFICLCLAFNNKVYAYLPTIVKQEVQNITEYKGLILDSDTKKPLPYADITVYGSHISIVSNKEGKFTLKVPASLVNQSISVSYLGYETYKVLLSKLHKQNNVIELIVSVTELDIINISAPKDAKSLIKKVIDNKGEYYTSEKLNMVAFYRETIRKGKKNASLAEAVVKILKQPYKSNKNDAVELIKSRKNTNYSRLDTIAVKLQGGPFSALYSDIVKYPKYVFTEETFTYYKFNFEPPTLINERQMYVVSFKQQSNVITPLYSGKLYIDTETLTLVRGLYHLNVDNKDEALQLFIRKKPAKVKVEPLLASYRVDYKLANGKWYYSYSNIELAFRVKWRKQLFGSTYTLNVEMAVTDWQKAFASKIHSNKRLRPSVILTDEASGFSDPEFWGAYNTIEPEKSISSAIKKIKKQLSKIEKRKKK